MSRLPDLARVSVYVKSTGGVRIAGKVMLAASFLSAFFGITSYIQSHAAQSEIDYRKSQLKRPVYKLTEDQMVNPPWNKDNLSEWLYRRVEVVGRPIIRLAMNLPTHEFDQPGYEQVVPLVTREDQNFKNRHGLLFNLGFIPEQLRHPTVRHRLERVDRQKFVCFVSQMSDLRNKSFFQGNAYQKGRLFYTCSDLEDMAKSSELLNKQQASVAILERLHETGVYDERSSHRRGCDAAFTEPYPWAKTESGALQMDKMPWDHRNDAKHYFLGSLFTFLVGASIF